MKKIKAYIFDIIFISVAMICLMVYAFSSPDRTGGRQTFSFPRYESGELLASEEIYMTPARNIAALFPAKKAAPRPAEPRTEPKAAEKPVVNSTYLKFVTTKTGDNGKKIYIVMDNTIMRLYELVPGKTVNGLKLAEDQGSYLLIEDSETIQKVKKE